jgi:uncharacterized repeat protein (TIGR01451 family)
VANSNSNTVSVIDAATATVTTSVTVGTSPGGVAVTPDGTKVYVANAGNFGGPFTVSVIDAATNTLATTIPIANTPNPGALEGIAITPDGKKVYVTSSFNGVYVIDTATNTVKVPTIPLPFANTGIAVTPDGTKVYVTAEFNGVSIINTATDTVTFTLPVGSSFIAPLNDAVTPDGKKVYVTNSDGTVSVIDTATNNVVNNVIVGLNVPNGIAITPDGVQVYIENGANVLAFNPATTTSITIQVPGGAKSFGLFIGPLITPSLHLDKVAAPTSYNAVGQIITYTYTVTNSGKVNIAAPITVTDNKLGTISILSSGTLTPGSSVTKTATYKITQADLDAGSITNLATATGLFSGQTITSNTGTAKVLAVQSPALTLVKSASPLSYDHVGELITYTYTVNNAGNVDISAPITVTDEKVGTISIQSSGILSPGSSVTGTATYKITDADINEGHVTNSVYATGSFNSKPVISPLAIAIVRYEEPTKKEEHNEEEHNGEPCNEGYGGAVVPMVPAPMMCGSPMCSSEPPMFGSEPSTTAAPSEPNVCEGKVSSSKCHKDKCALNKHKHHAKKHKAKKNC